nr:MAG TPA: hypothetical protein [Caudoviricetes sp.]
MNLPIANFVFVRYLYIRPTGKGYKNTSPHESGF